MTGQELGNTVWTAREAGCLGGRFGGTRAELVGPRGRSRGRMAWRVLGGGSGAGSAQDPVLCAKAGPARKHRAPHAGPGAGSPSRPRPLHARGASGPPGRSSTRPGTLAARRLRAALSAELATPRPARARTPRPASRLHGRLRGRARSTGQWQRGAPRGTCAPARGGGARAAESGARGARRGGVRAGGRGGARAALRADWPARRSEAVNGGAAGPRLQNKGLAARGAAAAAGGCLAPGGGGANGRSAPRAARAPRENRARADQAPAGWALRAGARTAERP